MPPRSLCAMAKAVAVKNVDRIYDVGNLTWAQVSNILSEVKYPDQLRLIEEASPQLRGDTAERWKHFIQRDYRLLAQSKQYTPSNPADWWKVYYKYMKEDDEQKAAALAKFKGDMAQIKKDKETHRTSMMGMRNAPRIAHPTWWGNRAAPKYFGKTKSEIALAKAIRVGGQAARANRVTPRSLSPANVIGCGVLDPRKRVTRAPAAMIQDHEIAQKPSRPPVRAPRKMGNVNHATGGIRRTVDPEAAAREERLKRIKEGEQPVPVSAEVLDREVEDLFGDGAERRAVPPKKTVVPTKSAVRPALPGRGGLASVLGLGSSTAGKIKRIPAMTTSSPSKNEQQHAPNTNLPSKSTKSTSYMGLASHVAPKNRAVPQHPERKAAGSETSLLPSGNVTNRRKRDDRETLVPIKRRKI